MIHKHQWYKREIADNRGHVIWGYVCKCGKKDYVDMSNKYKPLDTKNVS